MKTVIVLVTLILSLPETQAATYPVTGRWGYDASTGNGRIDCTNRAIVEFAGDRRFETGGKAPPDYRNVSVNQVNATTFRVVDLFFTGMQRGNVAYVLSIIDPDRIEMAHTMGGATFRLRRCA